MHLRELVGTSAKVNGDIEEMRASKYPLLILGGGVRGKLIADWFETESIKFEAFVETAKFWSEGKTLLGKSVYKYESLAEHFDKCNLFFAATGPGIMEIWNNPAPVVNKAYYINRYTPYFGDVKMTVDWLNEHLDEFDETYQMLEDEESRQIFLAYIEERTHCLKVKVPRIFELVSPSAAYFNELYDTNRYEHHTFADCGAFDGDSLEDFLKFMRAHNRTGSVYSFEPDMKNFKLLEQVAERMKAEGLGDDIRCFPCGVGDKNETISFVMSRSGIRSYFEGQGTPKDTVAGSVTEVKVVRLDDVLKGTTVSSIKMDIEGSEMSALHGAASIIKEQLPYLAICVYHRDDDLITIPRYIQQLARQAGKRYKFYLRQHNFAISDTVLYAVP